MEQDVRERLQAVFRKVFRMPELVLSERTRAEDIFRWDSLAHVQLMVALEREFSIRFRTGEIPTLRDVPALGAAIQRELGRRRKALS